MDRCVPCAGRILIFVIILSTFTPFSPKAQIDPAQVNYVPLSSVTELTGNPSLDLLTSTDHTFARPWEKDCNSKATPKMGRLIKNHLARLIILTAATYQIAAAIHGFFWPKIFWDMWTKALDPAVKPLPILQIFNVIAGIFGLCWEYPLPFLIPNTALHRSIAARIAIYPISIVLAALIYQGTNAAIYYIVGLIVYFWGHSEGEIVCMPWKVPTRRPLATPREPIKL